MVYIITNSKCFTKILRPGVYPKSLFHTVACWLSGNKGLKFAHLLFDEKWLYFIF